MVVFGAVILLSLCPNWTSARHLFFNIIGILLLGVSYKKLFIRSLNGVGFGVQLFFNPAGT